MDAIIKDFTGKYIDLDKLVSVSDAYFVDRMGSGGYFVSFTMQFQLMEKPITYTDSFQYDEYDISGRSESSYQLKSVTGGWIPAWGVEDKEILAVQRVQKQVDDLVRQWKEYKQFKERLHAKN